MFRFETTIKKEYIEFRIQYYNTDNKSKYLKFKFF